MTTSHPLPPVLDDAALARIMDATAPLLGIAIEPAWRDAVVANLKAVSAAARLVQAFPLDDELEPAPVFRA